MSIEPDHSNPSVTDPSNLIGSTVDADTKGTIRSQPHQLYSLAAAGWLLILATPLLFFPRVLSLIFGSLLTEGDGETEASVIRQLNVLERTLAGLTGMSCATLAGVLIVQTGAVPMTSSISTSHISSGTSEAPDAPFRSPTILLTTLYFGASAYFAYDLGMWLVTGGSGILVLWGLWAMLFGNESNVNKHNRKTGTIPPLQNHAAQAAARKDL